MKNFFSKLNRKFQGWMQGRYGYDEFSKVLIWGAFIFLILSMLCSPLGFLYPVALVLLIYAYIRCFSKNHEARRKELTVYFKAKNKVKGEFSLIKNKWKYRKTHRYFKCGSCKAVNRVPKGKGKIEITCRVCKNKMYIKT